MNACYLPFGNGFLNAINDITFILLCITGIINTMYVFIFEYGIVLNGPLVQLLDIFGHLEVAMIMAFPVIAVMILTTLVLVKFIGYVVPITGFLIAKCRRCESKYD